MNPLSRQILANRKAAGLTQEQLAEKLGVTPQSVSNWERGGAPDISMLPILANFFKITIDQLMGNDATNVSLRKNDFWEKYRQENDKRKRLDMLIDGYRKYPHDCNIMLCLMKHLPYDRKENQLFIEELCHKILSESPTPTLRDSALAIMCHVAAKENREKWLSMLPRKTEYRQQLMRAVCFHDDGNVELAAGYHYLLCFIQMEEFFAIHYPDDLGPATKAEFHRKQISVLESLGAASKKANAWTGVYAYKLLVLSACLFGCKEYENGWQIFDQAITQYKLWYSLPGHSLLDSGFGGIMITRDRCYAIFPDGTKEFIGDCIYQEANVPAEYLYRNLMSREYWGWFNTVREEQRFQDVTEWIQTII